MVPVEAGSFWMGCNEEVDLDCAADEYPYHEVTLSAYAIDRNEVTAAEYATCVQQGECTEPLYNLSGNGICISNTGTQPANCVTWFQADDYCSWAGGHLPTEAQWEKAARGNDGRLYPWGNEPPNCNLMNNGECGMNDFEPVGTYPAGASPYGALDMAGNVMEWTADWYSASYYIQTPDSDPQGPVTGTWRMIRSSIHIAGDIGARTSTRAAIYDGLFQVAPDSAGGFLGFRCAYVP